MTDAAPSAGRAWAERLTWLLPLVAAYVPLLLTQPGWIGADTKTYLYLDPVKLLADAPYAWDSQVGMGTVTHQNIGYLFPMGPYYLTMDLLGLPDWVAQRLWLGTILFAAGMGVRYLLRTIRIGGATLDHGAILVATFAYMFSPYFLAYAARISVILLPWVALPWLIALTARSLRRGGWWYPAAFALVVLAVGGINATALIMIGVGPLLWLIHAVAVERSATTRAALATVGRIGVLTLVTSLWWIAGLWAEGRHGLPVIRYTETYRAVSIASSGPEVLRGLGYWFFYGGDKLGPWIEPSTAYTTNVPLLALTYAIPTAALAGAALLRWRHRAYFVLVIVAGTLIAVGGHPWDASPLLGGIFKEATKTDIGLSLRSTPRAVPLVALGTAVLLGAAVAGLGRRLPRVRGPAVVAACVATYLAMPPLWTGTLVSENLRRPEDPTTASARYDHWFEAIDWLDARDPQTRIFEVPGIDFASYLWGNTVDPITPGLTDRPYLARELFQWGAPQSAAFLEAIDRRMQEGNAEPAAVAPIARTFAVGDIVLRADLRFERFRTPRPKQMWELLLEAPGLGDPVAFTPAVPVVAGPEQPLIDELELAQAPELTDPPLVSVFPVEDPLTIIRTQPVPEPLLVAGDADGLVGAAAAGLFRPERATFLSGSFAGDPGQIDTLLDADARLIVTDTNRRRAHRWGALRETTGYTERAGEEPPSYDPSDQRLAVFPDADDDSFTVAIHRGATVTATAYGNPITYTPEDRPAQAVDGDPRTAWRVGALGDPTGERLRIDLDAPVTVGELSLTQPLTNVRNRWITRVRLHFDDQDTIDAELDLSSRELPGQRISFPTRSFSTVEIEVLADDIGPRPNYDGLSGVGLSMVDIPGVSMDEIIRPPIDLLDAAGSRSADHDLAFQFERERANPLHSIRDDPERSIIRLLQVPTPRSFAVSGSARLAPDAPDHLLDQIIGLRSARQGGMTVTASAHLPSARTRASAAFDGDEGTAWYSIYDRQDGHWVAVDLAEPVTFDAFDLSVVADGRHSLPTRLRIEADGVPAATVDLPPFDAVPEIGHTITHRVSTPPITARTLRFILDEVDEVLTVDWYTDKDIALPVAIAEISIPGVRVDEPAAWFDSGCRADLLAIDGAPVAVRVEGPMADALHAAPLQVAACTADAISLAPGEHLLTTADGRALGIHLDRVVLSSAAGGAALAADAFGAPPVERGPPVEVRSSGRTSWELETTVDASPFWFALGQSWSTGWRATVDGVDLGEPVLINGYANGWLIDPEALGLAPGDRVPIVVAWTPQSIVWVALVLSVAGVVGCVALLVVGRRPRAAADALDGAPGDLAPRLERPAGRTSWPAAIVAAAALGLAALVTVPTTAATLATAAPVAALVLLAFRAPKGRALLGLAATGCLGLAGLYYVVWQLRFDFPSDFTWPTQFGRAHVLGILAIVLLAGEVWRELVVGSSDEGAEP